MTLTAFVFPKLRTLKTWLDKCLKSPASEGPSTSNMVNVKKTLFKSSSKQLYRFYWSMTRKLCSKMSLLLICQIFGPLVNTLVAD